MRVMVLLVVAVVVVQELMLEDIFVVDCSMLKKKSSCCGFALRCTPFRMVCLCVTVLMLVKCLSLLELKQLLN